MFGVGLPRTWVQVAARGTPHGGCWGGVPQSQAWVSCLCSPQGLLFSTPECLKQPQDLVKLYLHESDRVYRDRMVEEMDYEAFDKIQREMVKKCYDVSVEG